MQRRRLCGLSIAGLAVWSSLEAASPLGRWRLDEQRYEGGSANLAVAEEPLHLEFAQALTGLEARIWAGGRAESAMPWPTFLSDAGPVPVEIVEKSIDLGSGSIFARYRVRPSPTDDLVLEVTERYLVSEDGKSLAGEMRVAFTGGQTHRGGFVLHRRFGREP